MAKGWLDNYNDSKVSLPEGYVGEGYSIKGRDYSPAWGGRFQDGGKLTFLQPTSEKLPKGYRIPYADPSSELAMSIGGENGEPAYLIPSFKYGKPLYNPIEEFKKTGEHLGGPFKTWQEADKWEQEVRHPYVEKGQAIPMPIKTWGEMAMGGSIPGAVGFTYARTQSPAPSNGKYAKKTKASAQDGAKLDMHGSPITAIEKHRYDIDRSYYDPRTNIMNLGADYAASDNKDKMIAHENYHAKQHSEGRDNFDIGHNTENRQWAEMQKRPQMMSTREVWNNFYNRKAIESDMAISRIAERLPESQFFRDAAGDIIYDKIVDPTQYKIPYSFEGEAEYYENTGEEFQNGGWLNKYDVAQTGTQVKYGTPEYEEAYNRGEVITDEGGRSPIQLDEVVVQNNYKRNFWERYRDKIIEENKDASPLGAILGGTTSAVFSLPQLAMMDALTGKTQRPSEAVGFDTNEKLFASPASFSKHASNFVLDAVTDPLNIVGAGVLTKDKALARIAASTEEGLLSNAYKLNPYAFKANPEAYYHRSPNIENIINKEKQILQGFGESELGKQYSNQIRLSSDGKINLQKTAHNDLYTAKGTPLDYGRSNNWKQGYEGPYIAEITNQPMIAKVNGKLRKVLQSDGTYKIGVAPNELGSYAVPKGEVPLSNVKFYKEDWLRRYKEVPKQEDGGVIKDDRGQWDHPGEITEINSNDITMEGVPYDVLGISDEGDVQLMKPGKNYKFKGKKVTEFPMAKNGLRQEQKSLQNLDNLTNFTNYNKPQPGGWLNKYN